MYRSIMTPLGGSAFSEHALPLALSEARTGGCVTIILISLCSHRR
jgi:hypothetical protein